MLINLDIKKKPDDAFTDRFTMDEPQTYPKEGNSYQSVRIYVNKVSDFPFHRHYEVPFKCDIHNEYIAEKTEGNIYNKDGLHVTKSDLICKNEDTQANSFGVRFSATKEPLCRYLEIQENLINSCRCFRPDLPKDIATDPSIVSCYENYNVINCSSISDVAGSSCLPSCSKTDYAVTHKSIPIHNSQITEIFLKLAKIYNCESEELEWCQNLTNCALDGIFPHNTDVKCKNFIEETEDQSTCRESNSYNCSKVHLMLKMRPLVTLNSESLVVNKDTLLSQISGICAFFTGLTFTFIAEVIETAIIWRKGIPETV